MQIMWAVQVHEAEEDADSTLGWWVQHNSAELIVDHPGANNGFRSNICLWVQRQLSIVVLCNALWGEPRVVTDQVYRIFTSL